MHGSADGAEWNKEADWESLEEQIVDKTQQWK